MEIPVPPRFDSPMKLGSLVLPSRVHLAPLAGYTNLALRLTLRELGGLGLATTDLVNARALLEGLKKTRELIATTPADRPFAVQIFGSVPEEMTAAAQWLQDYGASSVDINMGCPVRKVVRSGGGSAMMCDSGSTIRLVERVVSSVRIPVTVKMRLGWDNQNLSAPEFARAFEEVGVAAVTIHGRTRAQGFGGQVSLEGIRAVVDAVREIPVIGNGDVRSLMDAARMFQETGCAGIAIGRGALLNPWIFHQLEHWLRTGEPASRATWQQRADLMVRHFRRLVEWRGEHLGCLQFRKVSNWYCRSLRSGKEIQQILIQVDTVATFDRALEMLRARGEPIGWSERDASDWSVPVPTGPISHW